MVALVWMQRHLACTTAGMVAQIVLLPIIHSDGSLTEQLQDKLFGVSVNKTTNKKFRIKYDVLT
jgi:hypothetical protein